MQIPDIQAIYINNLDRDVGRRHLVEAALKNLGFQKIIRSPGIFGEPPAPKTFAPLAHHLVVRV
jgi:hypothetical protein